MSTTAIFLNHVATLAFFHIADIVHACVHAKSLQSCPTLCDPMDYSLPGSSVWILQGRILEWVAMPSSMGSSDPGIEFVLPVASALQAASLPMTHEGGPRNCVIYLKFFVFFLKKETPQFPPTLGMEFIPF